MTKRLPLFIAALYFYRVKFLINIDLVQNNLTKMDQSRTLDARSVVLRADSVYNPDYNSYKRSESTIDFDGTEAGIYFFLKLFSFFGRI